jgi:hypothetical protein
LGLSRRNGQRRVHVHTSGVVGVQARVVGGGGGDLAYERDWEEHEEAINCSVFFLMLARDSSATNTFKMERMVGCAEEGFNQVTKQGGEGRREIMADGHGGRYKDGRREQVEQRTTETP